MITKRIRILILLGCIPVLFALTGYPTRAATPDWQVPSGFHLVREVPGVQLFRKDYPNGTPDFVQVVNLQQGAELVLMHGEITKSGQGQGVYGGDNPRFTRKSIQQFWGELAQTQQSPFCVSNGQFFRMADSPTPLPFPLKVNGTVLTDGYGENEFPGQKLVLELTNSQADIRELSKSDLYNSDAPDIIAGLTENAAKAAKRSTGRTFVGVADRDQNGSYETVFLLNTRTSLPGDAGDVLRAFGAAKVMMLDGGGSTQLVCQGEAIIDTTRLIPQAIGVLAGVQRIYSARLVESLAWPVLVQGENNLLKLRLENNGEESWQTGQTRIQVSSPAWSAPMDILIDKQVSPGDEVTLGMKAELQAAPGVYPIELTLVGSGETFQIENPNSGLVVIPHSMKSSRAELVNDLTSWQNQPGVDVSTEVQQWISENSETKNYLTSQESPQNYQPATFRGLLWVVLLILPIFALLAIVVQHIQHSQNL